MKNVRLFAVAAAMGMFASTVAAAETVTKDSYIATWGEVDEIVKVDVGDRVVAPTATIKVVKETRTTDIEKATQDTTFGVGSGIVCYKGFSNEVVKDVDGDGFEDKELKVLYKDGTTGKVNRDWYYTDAKFWPTTKTAMMYVGYKGREIYGARFLQPGSEKVENMYHYIPGHKDMATTADVIAFLEGNGTIVKVDADADGYNDAYVVNSKDYTVASGDNKGKKLGSIWTTLTVPTGRDGEVLLDEALVKRAFGATTYTDNDGKAVETTTTYSYTLTTGEGEEFVPEYIIKNDDETLTINEAKLTDGVIVVVRENRYGELEFVKELPSIAEGNMDSGVEVTKKENKIQVVTEVKADLYSVYATYSPTAQKDWTIQQEYKWDVVSGTFLPSDKVNTATGADADEKIAAAVAAVEGVSATADSVAYADDLTVVGLVQYSAEANTTDKYVLNTWGTKIGEEVVITSINTTKGVMTVKAPNNTEYTVSAVQLADKKWYPAVNTAEEMEAFFEIISGLHTPAWDTNPAGAEAAGAGEFTMTEVNGFLNAGAKTYSTRSYLDGTKNEKYIPTTPYGHYSGEQCTYKVAEGGEVDADITSNATLIDTKDPGVKTLTLTAKVGEDVVATKDVKVVVAPRYLREYKGGKVVKLTAFYLDGKTPYAVYNYDWTAKTYTATFYAQDGVTVVDSANGSL